MECKAPDGQACRGLRGGRIHGVCGEVEDPDDGGNECTASATHASARKQREAASGRPSTTKRKTIF